LRDEACQALATHLRGIQEALLSVAHQMPATPESPERDRVVRSQLEWAASHLFEAVRELVLVEPAQASAADDASAMTAASTVQVMQGLKGHSEAIAIPEVLGFISSLRKSGVLRVHSRDESFLVELDQGAVVYAQGDNPPSGTLLGEILVTQGALTGVQLEEVLDRESGANSQVLGKRLLEEGLISRQALCIGLAFQVQMLFHRMYGAEDAVFQFDEGVQILEPRDIRLNVTSLLLESARTSDERAWGAAQSRMPA